MVYSTTYSKSISSSIILASRIPVEREPQSLKLQKVIKEAQVCDQPTKTWLRQTITVPKHLFTGKQFTQWQAICSVASNLLTGNNNRSLAKKTFLVAKNSSTCKEFAHWLAKKFLTGKYFAHWQKDLLTGKEFSLWQKACSLAKSYLIGKMITQWQWALTKG